LRACPGTRKRKRNREREKRREKRRHPVPGFPPRSIRFFSEKPNSARGWEEEREREGEKTRGAKENF